MGLTDYYYFFFLSLKVLLRRGNSFYKNLIVKIILLLFLNINQLGFEGMCLNNIFLNQQIHSFSASCQPFFILKDHDQVMKNLEKDACVLVQINNV